MKQTISDFKIGQSISFDSPRGILVGVITELYKYPQEDEDGDTFEMVVEVGEEGEVNFQLSIENILEKISA